MPNYQNGKIYKIVNDINDNVYYGSTTQKYLCSRMSGHRKRPVSIKKLDCPISSCKIFLVEDFPCDTKEQLLQRERFYIENNECINKQIPTRTIREYQKTEKFKEYTKKYYKDYYQKNKKELNEKNKMYKRNRKITLN